MGFEDKTTRKLRAKLNANHVRTREWQGRTLSYVEGWHALSEANRIFGFDRWNRETVDLKCISEAKTQQSPHCAYIAKVRITVKAGEDTVVREGTGAGYSTASSMAEAHALAAKEAETDATKRALATFGNPFGLALYDRDKKGVRWPKPAKPTPAPREVRDAEGVITGRYSDPHACAQALLRLFEEAENADALASLWQNNKRIVSELPVVTPNGRTGSGPTENFERETGDRELASTVTLDLQARYQMRYEALSGFEQDQRATAGAETSAGSSDNSNSTEKDHAPDETHREFVERPGTANSVSADDGNERATRSSIEPDARTTPSAQPMAIDKSNLNLPTPKRIRAPEHLKRVAQMPCLVCQRQPADAHHLKHAQPRAMASKPGDQWVVPLCRIHHRALHDAGNETSWWQDHNIDPVSLAERLWFEHKSD